MMLSRREIRKSQSKVRDGKLRIENIEAAFTRAGLEQDYRTLVAAVGQRTLAETMTESWLDLTIRDLLADKALASANGHQPALHAASASA